MFLFCSDVLNLKCLVELNESNVTLLWPFGIKQFKIKIAYQKGLYLFPADLKYNT